MSCQAPPVPCNASYQKANEVLVLCGAASQVDAGRRRRPRSGRIQEAPRDPTAHPLGRKAAAAAAALAAVYCIGYLSVHPVSATVPCPNGRNEASHGGRLRRSSTVRCQDTVVARSIARRRRRGRVSLSVPTSSAYHLVRIQALSWGKARTMNTPESRHSRQKGGPGQGSSSSVQISSFL